MLWHHAVTTSIELVLKGNQFFETSSIVEEMRETSLSALGPMDLTVDMNWMLLSYAVKQLSLLISMHNVSHL